MTIALRLFGDDLDPTEVTAILGIEPTSSYRKGGAYRGNSTGFLGAGKMGAWILSHDYKQRTLGWSLKAVLHDLPNDLSLWHDMNERFSVDLFLALWMKETNEGFDLDVETSRMLADRRLKIGFSFYCPLAQRG